jgi:hypothetical protein
MMRNLLNRNLTPEERALGFRRLWIENHNNRFGGIFAEPHILEAIAYPVNESVWIFKMSLPNARPYYSEMQYGLSGLGKGETPDWSNVRASNWDDPVTAIQAATHLPRDLERIPVVPPRVIGSGEGRRIMFDAAHVTKAEVTGNDGERVTHDGREWISFPVRQ